VLKKVDSTDYNTTWGTIAGAVYQASAPSSPQTGDVWVDSDAVAGVLNQNDYLLKADFELVSIPVGGLTQYAGATSPSVNYAICDGAAVNRTTYATLFARIGTTYGVGDNSTTFNLPDLRTRIPVGKNATGTFATLGTTGGAETHTLTVAQMPSHTHPISVANVSTFSGIIGTTGHGGTLQPWTASTDATGGGGAHNNLQPYIVMNYLIRIL
jgi:microcystin-dependent protein